MRRLREAAWDGLLNLVLAVVLEATSTALQVKALHDCSEGDHNLVEQWADYGDAECTTLEACVRVHCDYERRIRWVLTADEEWEEAS